MNTYKASELIVLHLSAGKDTNGNPRRCFVLTHALDGYLDATDEGYEGTSAIEAFVPSRDKAVLAELHARIATKIDTSPSCYRHFVRRSYTSAIPYTVTL